MNINTIFNWNNFTKQNFIQAQQAEIKQLYDRIGQYPTLIKTIQIASVIFGLIALVSLPAYVFVSFSVLAFCMTFWSLTNERVIWITVTAFRVLGFNMEIATRVLSRHLNLNPTPLFLEHPCDPNKKDVEDIHPEEEFNIHPDEVLEIPIDEIDHVQQEQIPDQLHQNLIHELIPHPYYKFIEKYSNGKMNVLLNEYDDFSWLLTYQNAVHFLFTLSPLPIHFCQSLGLLRVVYQTPSLNNEPQKMDPGKHLTFLFKDAETVYGEETVERQDAIANLKNVLVKQMEMLKENLATIQRQFDDNPSVELLKKRQAIKAEISFCQKSLENAQNVSDDFIRTNFFRKELRKVIAQGRNYSKLVDGICITAPVNFRYHKCKITTKEVGFFRLGVMTDPRNGLTNLKELEELAKNANDLEAKIQDLGKQFRDLQKNHQKNYAKMATYEYALAQLDPKNIEMTIQERRHILSCQMVQLIQSQIEKNFNTLSNDSSEKIFNLAHVGLLNPQLNEIDPSLGWVHYEANQMVDMNEIFEEFNGKCLIFDGKGPCLDSDGNMHLSQILRDTAGNLRSITLQTHFINISVQGHTKNDGIQQVINQKSLPKLIKIAQQKIQANPSNQDFQEALQLLLAVQKKLNKGKSNYLIAEDLSVAILKLEIALSEGCFGAKDRTGYVAGRTVIRFVHEGMDTHSKLKAQPKLLNKLKNKFSKDLLNKNGCAVKVVKDNTNANILKCSSINLPGCSKPYRLIYYGKQAAGVILSSPP